MSYRTINGILVKKELDTHENEVAYVAGEAPQQVIRIMDKLWGVLSKFTSLQERAQACAFCLAADVGCMEDEEREEFMRALHIMIDECVEKNRVWNQARKQVSRCGNASP